VVGHAAFFSFLGFLFSQKGVWVAPGTRRMQSAFFLTLEKD